MARTVGDSVDDTATDLAEKLSELKAELGRITESIAKIAGSEARAVMDPALWEAQAQDMAKRLTEVVRKEPARTVAVAGIVGFVLGLIVMRR